MRFFVVLLILVQTVSLNNALARPSMTGKAVTNVGDIGEHYPLFLVEKSHHPGNITVVYTKLDPHCRVLPDRAHGFMPTLDFYWLMDESSYKPMAGPLKDGVRKRLQFTDAHWQQVDPTSFAVRTDDLSHVQHDIPNPTVQIKAAPQRGSLRGHRLADPGAFQWPCDDQAGVRLYQNRSHDDAQENGGDGGSGRHPD